MILLLVFAALFALGWIRAARRGGGLADRLRYGVVHGLVGVLAVFGVATIGDWQGLF